jgi:hypothetical protein
MVANRSSQADCTRQTQLNISAPNLTRKFYPSIRVSITQSDRLIGGAVSLHHGKTLIKGAESLDSENSAPTVFIGGRFSGTTLMPTPSQLCYAADGGITRELPQARFQARVVFLQLSAGHLDAKGVQPLSAVE